MVGLLSLSLSPSLSGFPVTGGESASSARTTKRDWVSKERCERCSRNGEAHFGGKDIMCKPLSLSSPLSPLSLLLSSPSPLPLSPLSLAAGDKGVRVMASVGRMQQPFGLSGASPRAHRISEWIEEREREGDPITTPIVR